MSVPESSLTRFSLGRPWQDVVAIGGGLALLNLLTVPSDLGWLSLNPSPWIVLPLLTGVRYGFRWGFLSGAVASLLLLITLLLTQRDMVAAHSLFFLALPALGLLAGEAHSLLAVRVPERENTVEVPASPSADPGAQPGVAEITPVPLPEPPAGPEAEPATLELQLRGLFEPGTGPVFPGLLRLLQANAGVTDAALYLIDGSSLSRTALLGTDEALPENLPLSDTGIAHLAVTRQSLVTCRQVWSTVPAQHSPWLAALPWPVSSGAARYLLLIHRMDGHAVNWRTFSRIQMICRWVAQFMELRQLEGLSEPTAGPLIVTPEIFRRTAADAAAASVSTACPPRWWPSASPLEPPPNTPPASARWWPRKCAPPTLPPSTLTAPSKCCSPSMARRRRNISINGSSASPPAMPCCRAGWRPALMGWPCRTGRRLDSFPWPSRYD